MRIIIGGAGEVGRGLAEVLLKEGKVVVLIDNNSEAIRESQSLNALVIQGDIKHRKLSKRLEYLSRIYLLLLLIQMSRI